ncbi:MAG: TRAP transporter small permease [Devosia sp.]
MVTTARHRFPHLVRQATALWAVLGGVVIGLVVAANVWSVAGGALFSRPVPGVYEIVQVGVAVAMFMFLPFCQITGANVTADIFTAGLGQRAQNLLAALGSTIAVAFAALLLWRMFYGLIDLQTYRETTTIYQFPLWIGYLPILISLALLLLACLVNLFEAATGTAPPREEAVH